MDTLRELSVAARQGRICFEYILRAAYRKGMSRLRRVCPLQHKSICVDQAPYLMRLFLRENSKLRWYRGKYSRPQSYFEDGIFLFFPL